MLPVCDNARDTKHHVTFCLIESKTSTAIFNRRDETDDSITPFEDSPMSSHWHTFSAYIQHHPTGGSFSFNVINETCKWDIRKTLWMISRVVCCVYWASKDYHHYQSQILEITKQIWKPQKLPWDVLSGSQDLNLALMRDKECQRVSLRSGWWWHSHHVYVVL